MIMHMEKCHAVATDLEDSRKTGVNLQHLLNLMITSECVFACLDEDLIYIQVSFHMNIQISSHINLISLNKFIDNIPQSSHTLKHPTHLNNFLMIPVSLLIGIEKR
ncbi:hypothetical protein ACJX0J_015999 [Zea mays]